MGEATAGWCYFPLLSTQENARLTDPFLLDEVEEMIKSCDGNKSPDRMVLILGPFEG